MKANGEERLAKGWLQLPAGGLIAQGSLIERWYTRSVHGRPHRYGPYYCWTRKVEGKTKTIALSKTQAQRLHGALAMQRRVQSILRTLYLMSEKILCSEVLGVAKRNRLPRK